MKNRLAHTLLRLVRQSFDYGAADKRSDRELLRCFVQERDEGALGVLVRRYGPMVYGICRRMLRHSQDVEDALQATCVTLARKAATTWWQDSIGNWLYGVALREARQLRRIRCRQVVIERELMRQPAASLGESALQKEK